MITLNFEIKKQKLKRIDKNVIVNKSKNIISCKFEFLDPENWGNIEKFAIFTNAKHDTYVCSLGKNMTCECIIPEEAMLGKFMKVGLFGGDRITTNNLIIPLLHSNFTINIKSSSQSTSDFFQYILKGLNGKYDDLELDGDKIYCYSDGNIKKILSFDNIVLNNYYTRSYIDEKLSVKYDDFSYSNGYLSCYSEGELKKRIPISVIADDFYNKKEIDEKINEINKCLDDCVVDGEITSNNDGVYFILKRLKEVKEND